MPALCQCVRTCCKLPNTTGHWLPPGGGHAAAAGVRERRFCLWRQAHQEMVRCRRALADCADCSWAGRCLYATVTEAACTMAKTLPAALLPGRYGSDAEKKGVLLVVTSAKVGQDTSLAQPLHCARHGSPRRLHNAAAHASPTHLHHHFPPMLAAGRRADWRCRLHGRCG